MMRHHFFLSLLFAILAIACFFFGWSLIAAVIFAVLAVILAIRGLTHGIFAVIGFILTLVILLFAIVFLVLFLCGISFFSWVFLALLI